MHVFVGYDPREDEAYQVCRSSILKHSPDSVVHPIHLYVCQILELYKRPFAYVDGKPYDPISNAPMSTEFALSRFLVPWLAEHLGIEDKYVLFCDADMLFRRNVDEILDCIHPDSDKSIWCVKHDVEHGEGVKMDGCAQTMYFRKNWSSVMLYNLDNQRLRLHDFNTQRGLWLHSFLWLDNSELGELPPEWNYLIDVSEPIADCAIAHYTLGIPLMDGYENCELADEWMEEYERITGDE